MSTSVSRRSPLAVHPTRQQLDDLDALLKRMLDLPVNRLEDEPDEEDASSQVEKDVRPTTPPGSEPMRGPHHPAFSGSSDNMAAAAAPVQYHTAPTDEADLKPRVIIVAPNAPENPTNSTALASLEAAKERPTGGRPEDWVPLTSSWRPSSRTWKPLTEAWQQAQGIDKETGRQEDKETGRQGDRDIRRQGGQVSELNPVVELKAPSVLPVSLSFGGPGTAHRATPPAPTPRWTPWYLWPFIGFNAAFDVCLGPWGPIGRWLRGPTGRALLGILGLLCLTAAAALAAADWIGWTS